MFGFSSRVVLALFILLCVSSANGHNKVVVVPLGGDDPVAAICVALGSTAGCDLAAVIAAALPRYAVGGKGPAGGTVFFTTDGGLHGLEAAFTDSAISVWGCAGAMIEGTSTAIGTGAQNTAAIVARCRTAAAPTAAEVANSYEFNSFTDWYLPSKEELNQLYLQQGVVGGLVSSYYWSSSENDSINAWLQLFNGSQVAADKNVTYGVRAVRAF